MITAAGNSQCRGHGCNDIKKGNNIKPEAVLRSRPRATEPVFAQPDSN